MAAPLLGRPGRDAAGRVRRSARVHANSGSAQVVVSAHGRVWLRTLVELVRDLSFSYRQLVEIAKALSYGGKVLILDEPTSALNEHETGILLRQLKRLKENGVGIIYRASDRF